MQTKEEVVREIILEALGESSALFMSQGKTPAGEIIMPSSELSRIGDEAVSKILKYENKNI